MRNFVWSFLMFFCFIFVSFSQTKSIEKGSYVSTAKGQKIKLNLLEDNKYELVFYSGDYKIKGDSLLFFQNTKTENAFNVEFKKDKKAKKIKIKFLDPSYYAFYVGTQKDSEPVQYQKVSDIRTKADPDWTHTDVEFEIDRADYLYLVYEGYETESQLSKFALPKDVSEVTVKYELDVLGDLNISGFFDKNTNELRVAEQAGKNPLVFVNEKDFKPENSSKIKPVESAKISNWTYPGKEALVQEDFGSEVTVDSAAAVVDYNTPKFDFKFKIENTLKTAIAATKTAKTKYLVVYNDSKKTAKTDFDAVVKDLEVQVGYYMYEMYNPQYDVFNYYLAAADDKKWLKTNKISDTPSVIIVNGDGAILAAAKSTLLDKKSEFTYYEEFYKKLQRTDALLSFNKLIKSKKVADADLVQAFYRASILDMPYNYDAEYAVAEEKAAADFVMTKSVLDKKEVLQAWKKLIETHQKDTNPNKYLVQAILRQIKNQGFYKQFFNEDRVFDDTDFLAIDYLLKHYDDVQKMNVEDENGEALSLLFGNLSSEISSALQENTTVLSESGKNPNKDKTIAVYKKLIAAEKGNFDIYKNYFVFLSSESETSTDDTVYLKEFSTYFDTYLAAEKGNAIQRLDDMFSTIDPDMEYTYNGWNGFKEYQSNLSNSAAWAVVLKPANASFIKPAIKWSEYSLIVTKNNPYYLDTLAQLYYKDGQKEKAIETQTLAVKYLTEAIEEETALEIKETLTKMQNGTY